MSDICNVCGKEKRSWSTYKGEHMCIECKDKLRKEDILNNASESDSPSFFKEWSNKDRATAFFEAFGRYVKEPNKRDFMTIMHIWYWAMHADHGLSTTISYTFKWTKFDLKVERARWK